MILCLGHDDRSENFECFLNQHVSITQIRKLKLTEDRRLPQSHAFSKSNISILIPNSVFLLIHQIVFFKILCPGICVALIKFHSIEHHIHPLIHSFKKFVH